MVKKDYAKRSAKEYNWWRTFFQWLVCGKLYRIRLDLVYRLKIKGMKNVPKTNDYIVCVNHLSTLDPPMMAGLMPRRVSFMAKKELFEIPFLRTWLDWLGAFAVDRERLGSATMKTVKAIKDTNWVFGIFPQGRREAPGTISGVTKGFAGIARITKCNILPVGITGTHEVKRWPFTGRVVVNIGEIIPYSDDLDDVVSKWGNAVAELTGFEYIPEKE